MSERNKAAGWKETSTFRQFYYKLIYKRFAGLVEIFDIYYVYICKILSVFSLATLIFLNSFVLKNQFTSNWTASDIVKGNSQSHKHTVWWVIMTPLSKLFDPGRAKYHFTLNIMKFYPIQFLWQYISDWNNICPL